MPPESLDVAWPRVAIVGSGTTALLAAALLGRILPPGHVTLLGMGAAPPDPADHCTRLPPDAEELHGRIGLGEALLRDEGGASECRADSYARWPGLDPWLLPAAAEWVGHAVLHAWLRDPAEPFGHWLARRTPPGRTTLRIVPARYRALLMRVVAGLPVRRMMAGNFGAERAADGTLAALVAEGTRIAADWFVDATGPAALLANAAGARPVPLRRPTALLALGDGAGGTGADDRWQALPEGWALHIGGSPAPQAMGFSGEGITAPTAAHIFAAATGAPPHHLLALPTMRRRDWTGNVLALGSAGFTPDPLAQADLQLVHAALLLLARALPGRRVVPAAQADFMRHLAAGQDAAADYALCLARVHRPGPFWRHAAGLPLSPDLARMIDQSARRGRLPPAEDGTIPPGQWRTLLAALGHHPGRPDALARNDMRRSGQGHA